MTYNCSIKEQSIRYQIQSDRAHVLRIISIVPVCVRVMKKFTTCTDDATNTINGNFDIASGSCTVASTTTTIDHTEETSENEEDCFDSVVKICDCERINESARVRCLARALYTFFKKRHLLNFYSRKTIESASRVIDVDFADIYTNNIQNITNKAAESIILLRFLDTFSAKHPKFAAETRFVEFIKYSDLFKEL